MDIQIRMMFQSEKTEKTTRVLTIQSSDLDVSKKVYADKDRCNYQKALPIYRRLFDDYNRMKETDYSSFFLGDFSKLKQKIWIRQLKEPVI